MNDVFIGRQPILDRELGIAFFELLYRGSMQNAAVFSNSEQATSEVLVNSLIDIGLERIAGNHKVFVNLTREYLIGEWALPLDRERIGIELLEDQLVDQALIDALTARSREGYMIALDDFVYQPHLKPLLYIADMAKLDVAALGREGAVDQYRLLRNFPLKLVAEKVETRSEYEFYRELGFDYFQGHFISRPHVIRGKGVTVNHGATLMLLAEINQTDVSLERLEALISSDVGLSFKLLRYINSAFFSLNRKIGTVREALIYVGLRQLKVWVSLLMVFSLQDQPLALRNQTIVRARFCENLARGSGESDPGRFFTIGLFSELDALLDVPMSSVLETLPLSEEVKLALTEGAGLLGRTLQCARDHEDGEWRQSRYLDLDAAAVNTAYLEAIDWADQFSHLMD